MQVNQLMVVTEIEEKQEEREEMLRVHDYNEASTDDILAKPQQ